MKTLIIYDNDGKVFDMQVAPYDIPNGLQHVEFDIPDGFFVKAIDVDSNPVKPIYYDDVPADKVADAINDIDAIKSSIGNKDDVIGSGKDLTKYSIMARLNALEMIVSMK